MAQDATGVPAGQPRLGVPEVRPIDGVGAKYIGHGFLPVVWRNTVLQKGTVHKALTA
jgi:hypothetical protein